MKKLKWALVILVPFVFVGIWFLLLQAMGLLVLDNEFAKTFSGILSFVAVYIAVINIAFE